MEIEISSLGLIRFLGSSFCYLNMATSGRQGFLLPQGLSCQESVRIANLIANRTMILADVSIVLQQVVGVEQPHHARGLAAQPRWQQLFTKHRLFRASCKQGAYAAETVKPTWLYSQHVRFAALKDEISSDDKQRIDTTGKELVTKKRNASGDLKVTGKRGELKSTQTYTPAFGLLESLLCKHGEASAFPSCKYR